MRAFALTLVLALAACQPGAASGQESPGDPEDSALAVSEYAMIAEMGDAMVVAFGDVVATPDGQALRTTELLKAPPNVRLARDLPLGDAHTDAEGSSALAVFGDGMDLLRLVPGDDSLVETYRDAFPD